MSNFYSLKIGYCQYMKSLAKKTVVRIDNLHQTAHKFEVSIQLDLSFDRRRNQSKAPYGIVEWCGDDMNVTSLVASGGVLRSSRSPCRNGGEIVHIDKINRALDEIYECILSESLGIRSIIRCHSMRAFINRSVCERRPCCPRQDSRGRRRHGRSFQRQGSE
jgi:hypothetical protein